MNKLIFNKELEFGKGKYLDLLHKIDWNKLRRESNKILMVDMDGKIENIEDKFEVNNLLNVDSFIVNLSHELNVIGSIIHYNILEIIRVGNHNLIIIVESYYFNSHENVD